MQGLNKNSKNQNVLNVNYPRSQLDHLQLKIIDFWIFELSKKQWKSFKQNSNKPRSH